MASVTRRILGFTLIEMMVVLAVAVVLLLLAVPSFRAFQQRSALRGGAEQALSFWNQARFEAAKRNKMVKVVVVGSGENFCLGAAETTTVNDDTTCDCLTAGACNVASFPADQDEWRDVTLSGTPTLGTTNPVAVIEPKRTSLATPSQAGTITFAGPPGSNSYKLNLRVDELGRAMVCESTSATHKMSDYTDKRCAP